MAQFGSEALATTRTVFIGGSTVPDLLGFSLDPNGNLRFGNAIQIEGSDDFKAIAADRLIRMAERVSGQQILQSLEASKRQVLIKETPSGEGCYQIPHDDAGAGHVCIQAEQYAGAR
jgi:hypothetical protein